MILGRRGVAMRGTTGSGLLRMAAELLQPFLRAVSRLRELHRGETRLQMEITAAVVDPRS